MPGVFKSFLVSALITVLILAAAGYWLRPSAILPLIVLMVIEVAFSFDNAVVNAKILTKLSRFWQTMFLTVGIVLAVFVVRFILPIVIVALSAGLSWQDVLYLALNQPDRYEAELAASHGLVMGFGGAFLLTLALHFFITERRQHFWLIPAEKFLASLKWWWLPSLAALVCLGLISWLAASHNLQIFIAGLAGVVLYLIMHGLEILLGRYQRRVASHNLYTGRLAFLMFIYLQVLDASFSLDGVLGAFAITSDAILIAAGLGVGAFWVRSLTVHMVRRGTLETYPNLEPGAYWAILILALGMLLSVFINFPEIITGLVSVVFIATAFWSSWRDREERVV